MRRIVPPDKNIAIELQRNPTRQGLLTVLTTRGYTNCKDLNCFLKAVQTPAFAASFERELLPFICLEALKFDEHWPSGELFIIDNQAPEDKRIITLTQRQCLCIQCNAFLCAWPQRTSSNCSCVEFPDMPSINLDEMMRAEGNPGPQAAKCEMFLHYVDKQLRRVTQGDPLQRLITFVRSRRNTPVWTSSERPLCRIEMQELRQSIDTATEALRADFANKYVGGGSIAYGCVQEEIMFACHPELNCARLFFSYMLDDESFILCGAERFATPGGYAFNLRCDAPYDDPAQHLQLNLGTSLNCFVSAIDAVDFRGQGTTQQYTRRFVQRDLLKAYSGFAVPEYLTAPKELATGNWGSGAFLGDACLKCLIQWAAASEAGHEKVLYFPFDNSTLFEQLPAIESRLVRSGITVGQLCQWLLSDTLDPRKPILNQLEAHFSSMPPSRPINAGYTNAGYTNQAASTGKPQCFTPGCSRTPYSDKLGDACCRTCSRTGGRDHGEACNTNNKVIKVAEAVCEGGHVMPATASYCERCGKPRRGLTITPSGWPKVRKCVNGHDMSPHANFCGQCGKGPAPSHDSGPK